MIPRWKAASGSDCLLLSTYCLLPSEIRHASTRNRAGLYLTTNFLVRLSSSQAARGIRHGSCQLAPRRTEMNPNNFRNKLGRIVLPLLFLVGIGVASSTAVQAQW